MARFRATVQGMRGEASRLGSKDSGIRTNANGWDSGVIVFGWVDDQEQDVFEIYQTGGSNGGEFRPIAKIVAGQLVSSVTDPERAERADRNARLIAMQSGTYVPGD